MVKAWSSRNGRLWVVTATTCSWISVKEIRASRASALGHCDDSRKRDGKYAGASGIAGVVVVTA